MILTIVILLALCFSLILILNELYKKSKHFKSIFSDIENIKTYCNKDIKYDIINLGSSHPKYAFNYSDIKEYKCANWAVRPETLEYDFFILRSYYTYIKEGGTVIIPICPLKMFLYKYKDKNSNLKYYKSRDIKVIPDYSFLFALKEFYFPLFFHPKRIRLLFKKNKTENKENFDINPLNNSELLKDADFWIKECWNPQFNINIENMKQLSEEIISSINKNIEILKKMIIFCLKNNLKPVICYLPITTYLGNKFSKDFIDIHIKRYVLEAIDGMDIKVVDLMKDERFTDKDLYFNSFFLNSRGSKIFTKQFINDVCVCKTKK